MAAANRDKASLASSRECYDLLYLFGRFWLDVKLGARMERPRPR